MYSYHLKFELYIPASPDFPIDIKNKKKSVFPTDPFYIPKDIFETLPIHPQDKSVNQPFLLYSNSKVKEHHKTKAKSVDLSKNTINLTSEIPSIPPTPVSKDNTSNSPSNSLNWTTVGRHKSLTTTTTSSGNFSSIVHNPKNPNNNLNKTHDFRFGKITTEWFDNNCEEESEIESMSDNQQKQNLGSYADAVKDVQDEVPAQSSNTSSLNNLTARSNNNNDNNNQKTTKSSSDKLINSPTGEFVPIKSGKTNLSYGILHLYRDPKEIPSPNQENESTVKSKEKDESLEDEFFNKDNTILAVLAVPSYLSASDFLGFVASVGRFVSHFRFIRDSAPNKFIVLMKFRHARAANDFYKQYNGRPFSSMEPEICHVVYIKSIEFKSISIPPYAFPFLHDPFLHTTQDISQQITTNDQIQQSSYLYELPTCPVCLERMDASVTGLLTILCQHTFHCNCLSKWGDSSCPVCRYSQKRNIQDSYLESSECGVCGATENLWICLVCGNIGCGRYQEAHAYCHYKETSHLYALELETQRVWDYAGDGYVHRLIQNKSDGKIVELPSPDVPPQQQQPRTDPVDQEKLDAIGLEYSYLLSTQLSSQRVYYEEKLESITLKLSNLTKQCQKLADDVSILNQDRDKYKRENEFLEKEKIPNLLKEKKTIEKKVEKFTERSEKLEKELNEEKELTKSLLSKQNYLETQLKDKDSKIKDFEEQIRDLMFFFSAQEKIKETPELSGGNVFVPENSNTGSLKKKKGKK